MASAPNSNDNNSTDLAPKTVITVTKINNWEGKFYYKTLFNSGWTDCIIIGCSSLPQGFKAFKLDWPISMGKANDQANCRESFIYNITFLELTYLSHCIKIKYIIIDKKINYNVIVGWKFLQEAEFMFDFSNDTAIWYENVMSFNTHNYFNNNEHKEDSF